MRPKLFLLVVIPLAVGIILAGMYFTSGQSSIDRVKTKSAPAAIEPTSAPLVEYRWREDPCHVLHFAGDVKERTGIIRAVFPGPIWEIEDEADGQLRTIHPFGVASSPFYNKREADWRVVYYILEPQDGAHDNHIQGINQGMISNFTGELEIERSLNSAYVRNGLSRPDPNAPPGLLECLQDLERNAQESDWGYWLDGAFQEHLSIQAMVTINATREAAERGK